MWQLYKLIGKAIPEQEKESLVDEVFEITKGINNFEFINSMNILFRKDRMIKSKIEKHEYAVLFVDGIKNSGILDFSHFIRKVLS